MVPSLLLKYMKSKPSWPNKQRVSHAYNHCGCTKLIPASFSSSLPEPSAHESTVALDINGNAESLSYHIFLYSTWLKNLVHTAWFVYISHRRPQRAYCLRIKNETGDSSAHIFNNAIPSQTLPAAAYITAPSPSLSILRSNSPGIMKESAPSLSHVYQSIFPSPVLSLLSSLLRHMSSQAISTKIYPRSCLWG